MDHAVDHAYDHRAGDDPDGQSACKLDRVDGTGEEIRLVLAHRANHRVVERRTGNQGNKRGEQKDRGGRF